VINRVYFRFEGTSRYNKRWFLALQAIDMIVEYSITIHKSLFDVFKMATDYEQQPSWQPSIRMAKVTPNDPVRTGSMLYMEKTLPVGLVFINADITEFNRNKSVEMQGVHGRFRFKRTTEFASTGRETIVRDKIEMPTGCLYFWYTPLLQNMLRAQMTKEWTLLKKRLETNA